MLITRLPLHTARKTNRGGFTLVELLVVIGIIAILAGVALGPITHGLESAKESAGMQTSRTIGISEFQYQTDNGNDPGGAKSQDVAVALILGGYITDPSIFAQSRGTAYAGATTGLTINATSGTSSGMPASAICWDFIVEKAVGAAPALGLGTADPDGMPAVFSTGQAIVIPQQGPSTPLPLNTSTTSPNPFGMNGIAVTYKSNSALFLKAGNVAGTSEINTNAANTMFNGSFSCTPGNYVQITPQ